MGNRILIACFSIFCTCSLLWARPINQSDLQWADEYLQERIEGLDKEPLKEYPQVHELKWPWDWETRGFLALTITQTNWLPELLPIIGPAKKVPKEGEVLIPTYADWDEILWKGVMIHELCHYRDYRTSATCRCDPYTMQQLYYLEQGWSIKQIYDETAWKKHSIPRSCYLKKGILVTLHEAN